MPTTGGHPSRSIYYIFRSIIHVFNFLQDFTSTTTNSISSFFYFLYNFPMASSGDESKKKKLQLYSFWRSSCSFRVHFALKMKGLDYDIKTVDLLKGEQYAPEFLKLNPIHTVPVLVDGDVVVADSVAIIMYLEEKFPQHPLLPQDIHKRALNFQAANIICTSIQPYQNLPALKMIAEKLGTDEVVPFILQQIRKGFGALEKLLKDCSGKYATGDEVYLADLCIAPQIDAAVGRFNLDMNEFPLLLRFYEAYKEMPAFQTSLPGKQPDAPIEHRI